MKCISKSLANMNEHSYAIRVDETGTGVYGKDIFYGHAGMISVVRGTGLSMRMQGMDMKFDRYAEEFYNADECELIFGNNSNQVLYIENNRFDLKFYGSDQILELLKKAGVTIV